MNTSYRIYELNELFFDTWSREMAYVLGFWFADGYMRHEKSYRIVFTGADRSILAQIQQALSSSHPLRKRIEKTGSSTWVLSLYSRHLYESLQLLGGSRAKTAHMHFPEVPQAYLPDFIRGYFDGDGSVFFVTYFRTKDMRITKELRTNFTSGSLSFLTNLMHILHDELDLSIKKIGIYGNGGSFKLGYGMKDSYALLRYMYYANFPIGLRRKSSFVAKIP